jgi:hypothetical protein
MINQTDLGRTGVGAPAVHRRKEAEPYRTCKTHVDRIVFVAHSAPIERERNRKISSHSGLVHGLREERIYVRIASSFFFFFFFFFLFRCSCSSSSSSGYCGFDFFCRKWDSNPRPACDPCFEGFKLGGHLLARGDSAQTQKKVGDDYREQNRTEQNRTEQRMQKRREASSASP